MEGKGIQCSDTCCKFYITTPLVIPSHPSQRHELSSILVSIQLNQKQGTENILEEKGSILWMQKNFAKTGKCQQGCVSPPKSKCLGADPDTGSCCLRSLCLCAPESQLWRKQSGAGTTGSTPGGREAMYVFFPVDTGDTNRIEQCGH